MNENIIFDYFENQLDLSKNFDILKKEIYINNKGIKLFYLTSLIDPIQFDYLMESLINDIPIKEIKVASVLELNDLNTALFFLFSGAVITFINNEVFAVDIRMYPTRGINEPDTEKGIRTSKDGFVETLIFNIALIRRRIKSNDLKVEHFIVSDISKSSVALIYMDSLVDKYLLNNIKNELKNININSLIMQEKALEETLFIKKEKIFPIIKYSERPDVTSIQILNGKIALLIDTSSVCLILPCSLFDHLAHVEEYKESYIIGSFMRLIRSIGVLLSFILLPLFICLISDKDISNNIININISSEIITPIYIQVIFAYLILEIIRIASLHSISSYITSLSLLAALILGEISFKLNIFSPEIIFIVAFTSICNLATPSYELSLANRLVSIVLTILSLMFNYEGLLIGLIILFIHLVSIKSFNRPYLYPIVPFDLKEFKHLFIRKNSNDKKMH